MPRKSAQSSAPTPEAAFALLARGRARRDEIRSRLLPAAQGRSAAARAHFNATRQQHPIDTLQARKAELRGLPPPLHPDVEAAADELAEAEAAELALIDELEQLEADAPGLARQATEEESARLAPRLAEISRSYVAGASAMLAAAAKRQTMADELSSAGLNSSSAPELKGWAPSSHVLMVLQNELHALRAQGLAPAESDIDGVQS